MGHRLKRKCQGEPVIPNEENSMQFFNIVEGSHCVVDRIFFPPAMIIVSTNIVFSSCSIQNILHF
jgi:hypothetical protein